MKSNTKTKAIRSKRMAWLLRKAGFEMLSVIPDRHSPQHDLYIFEVTPQFQEELDKIIENSRLEKLNEGKKGAELEHGKQGRLCDCKQT